LAPAFSDWNSREIFKSTISAVAFNTLSTEGAFRHPIRLHLVASLAEWPIGCCPVPSDSTKRSLKLCGKPKKENQPT